MPDRHFSTSTPKDNQPMFTNANLILFKQPDPVERAAIERRLNRPLTPAEILHGRLDRGTPGFHDQIPSTKLANVDVHPLDRQLADAKRRLAEEEYRALSPAAREVRMLEDLRAADAAKAAAALAHDKQQSLVKPLVEKLDALLEANRFNPDYSYADFQALVVAREQLMLEGACPEHAVELCRGAFGVVQAKEDARKAASQKRLEELVAQKAAIESELGIASQSPSTTRVISEPSPERQAARRKSFAAEDAYQAAKKSGVKGEPLEALRKAYFAAGAELRKVVEKEDSPAAPPPALTAPTADAPTGGVA
jgi:hypothetical protein